MSWLTALRLACCWNHFLISTGFLINVVPELAVDLDPFISAGRKREQEERENRLLQLGPW